MVDQKLTFLGNITRDPETRTYRGEMHIDGFPIEFVIDERDCDAAHGNVGETTWRAVDRRVCELVGTLW